MPSLKDARALTEQLQGLTAELHTELAGDEVDFERMIDLADQISEQADGLASAFNTVNDALLQRINEIRDGSSSQGDSGGGNGGQEEQKKSSGRGGGKSRAKSKK